MPGFENQHLNGCTPLIPCKHCQTVAALRGALSPKDFGAVANILGGTSMFGEEEMVPSPAEMALDEHGHLRIDEVFTKELCCDELNFSSHTLSLLLGVCRLHSDLDDSWDTLAKLTLRSESRMREMPNVGNKSINLIKAVLARYNLSLAIE